MTTGQSYLNIKLQQGPVGEDGVNGCQIDEVVAYSRDRITEFNTKEDGKFRCVENDESLINLRKALFWLNERTANRVNAGVEGTDRAIPEHKADSTERA